MNCWSVFDHFVGLGVKGLRLELFFLSMFSAIPQEVINAENIEKRERFI